jgi:hypothetical protein
VNSRSAPGRILAHHPLDESSKLGIDLWPAEAPWARSQAPEKPKASPVPGDNGFRFDNDKNVAPCRPKPAQQNPKHPILHSQSRARMLWFEYAQLLAQGEDFEAEVVAETEESAHAGDEGNEKWDHEPGFIAREPIPALGLTA